jgi:hypothetical protein
MKSGQRLENLIDRGGSSGPGAAGWIFDRQIVSASSDPVRPLARPTQRAWQSKLRPRFTVLARLYESSPLLAKGFVECTVWLSDYVWKLQLEDKTSQISKLTVDLRLPFPY